MAENPALRGSPRQDRRVRRTKTALKEALLGLILERGYDRITIRDITERANVGRSTFYSHFDSKEELLFSGFDRWVLSLAEQHHGPGAASSQGVDGSRGADITGGEGCDDRLFQSTLPLLKHVRTQPLFFRATMGPGSGTRVARRIRALFRTLMHRELDRIESALEASPRAEGASWEAQREAKVRFLVDGFLGLTTWWLENPGEMTVEQVDDVFQEIGAGAVDWSRVAAREP